jgi:hypothetical protein
LHTHYYFDDAHDVHGGDGGDDGDDDDVILYYALYNTNK